jgi:DNA-binding transcriptional ArsR family regulator
MPYDRQVGHYVKLASTRRRVRRPPKKLFILGPIAVSLVARCRALHPEALALLLRLKADADTLGVPVLAGRALAQSIGLHPRAAGRALVALESDGLVDVDRRRGCAPRVWLDPSVFDPGRAS